jgi:hypothetical protein
VSVYLQQTIRIHHFDLIPDASNVATAFGYTTEQLQSVPDQALMGLGCGNPVVAATIRLVRIIAGTPLECQLLPC